MKENNMTLLIMAAGNGSRYGALKQFDALGPNDEFLFEYSIYDAISNGFNHIVIITKEQFVDEIKNYLSQRISDKIKLDVIAQKVSNLPPSFNSQDFNREKPWGTAHAVWVAKNYIKNSFIIINADDHYGKKAFELAADFIENKTKENEYALVPYLLNDTLSKYGTVSRGICKTEKDNLIEVKEVLKIEKKGDEILDIDSNTILNENELISMNLWICEPSIFNEIETQFINFLNDKEDINKKEILIPLIIQNLIESEFVKVKVTQAGDSWFGVTYANDKENAVELLKEMSINNEYPSPLWKN